MITAQCKSRFAAIITTVRSGLDTRNTAAWRALDELEAVLYAEATGIATGAAAWDAMQAARRAGRP